MRPHCYVYRAMGVNEQNVVKLLEGGEEEDGGRWSRGLIPLCVLGIKSQEAINRALCTTSKHRRDRLTDQTEENHLVLVQSCKTYMVYRYKFLYFSAAS